MRVLRAVRNALVMAPLVIAPQAEAGSIDVSLGVGLGQYEFVTRSCEGDLLSSRPLKYALYGAKIDVRPAQVSKLRLIGFGGYTSVTGEVTDPEGAYGGALIGIEWERFAIGAGVGSFPDASFEGAVPVGHLRIGSRRSHARFDLFTPSPTPGVTGFLRGGFGFSRESVRGTVGLGAGRVYQVDDLENGGPFFDLEIPVRDAFDLTLRGSWHFGEENSDWAFAAGTQFRMRR